MSARDPEPGVKCPPFSLSPDLRKGDWLNRGVVRAKRPTRLPAVLSRQEVKTVLSLLCGTDSIMATLLYGAGLRLMECMRLRVKRHRLLYY